jgi:hypothetical protein
MLFMLSWLFDALIMNLISLRGRFQSSSFLVVVACLALRRRGRFTLAFDFGVALIGDCVVLSDYGCHVCVVDMVRERPGFS